MGAQENKRLMQEIFAGIAQGDSKLFLEHLAEEVTMRVTGQYSWSRTFRGRESVLRDLYGYVRSVTDGTIRTKPLRFIADDDYVVVEGKGDMTSKAGVRYDNDYCLIYRLANGKIVEMTEYQDSTLCERVLGPYRGANA